MLSASLATLEEWIDDILDDNADDDVQTNEDL